MSGALNSFAETGEPGASPRSATRSASRPGVQQDMNDSLAPEGGTQFLAGQQHRPAAGARRQGLATLPARRGAAVGGQPTGRRRPGIPPARRGPVRTRQACAGPARQARSVRCSGAPASVRSGRRDRRHATGLRRAPWRTAFFAKRVFTISRLGAQPHSPSRQTSCQVGNNTSVGAEHEPHQRLGRAGSRRSRDSGAAGPTCRRRRPRHAAPVRSPRRVRRASCALPPASPKRRGPAPRPPPSRRRTNARAPP